MTTEKGVFIDVRWKVGETSFQSLRNVSCWSFFSIPIIIHFIFRGESLLREKLDAMIGGEKNFFIILLFLFQGNVTESESESPNYPRCSVAKRQLLCIASNEFQNCLRKHVASVKIVSNYKKNSLGRSQGEKSRRRRRGESFQ